MDCMKYLEFLDILDLKRANERWEHADPITLMKEHLSRAICKDETSVKEEMELQKSWSK